MASPFFLYARKSTESEERQVLSIESQLAELRSLAQKEGIIIKQEFTEAMTAKVTGRPIFNEMILKIVAGEAQGILAWHPDRLSRNLMDAARIVELLDKKYLLSLKFPTCRFENNSMDKFMLSISFGQSKHYIDALSENVKRGLHRKFQRGEWPGWAYMGYFNDKNLRKVVVDPVKGPLVKKMFHAAATGQYTLQSLRKVTASWGLVSRPGKPLSKSEIHRTLTRPFYYGLMKYGREWRMGTHEPLISKELFDQVKEALVRNGKPNKYKKHPFPLLGLAFCEACGCPITAELQKGHHYYRCTKKRGKCSQPYTREELFSQQIKDALSGVALSDPALDFLLSEWAKEREESSQPVAQLKAKLAKEVPTIQAKIDRLLDAHIGGLISQSEYVAKKEFLLNQKIDLEAQLKKLEEGATGWLEPSKKFLEAAHHAGKLSSVENLEAQKEFLKKIGSNFRLGGRRLSFQFLPPWGLFSDFSCFSDSSAEETAIPAGSFSTPLAAIAAKNFENPDHLQKLRRGGDSNPR